MTHVYRQPLSLFLSYVVYTVYLLVTTVWSNPSHATCWLHNFFPQNLKKNIIGSKTLYGKLSEQSHISNTINFQDFFVNN